MGRKWQLISGGGSALQVTESNFQHAPFWGSQLLAARNESWLNGRGRSVQGLADWAHPSVESAEKTSYSCH